MLGEISSPSLILYVVYVDSEGILGGCVVSRTQ